MNLQSLTLAINVLILLILGGIALCIIVYELRLKPKRKRKVRFGGFVYPVAQYERDEAYWQNRLEAARTAVVDAQREYRDTLEDYAKWLADEAMEQARWGWSDTPATSDDNAIPIEPESKLLAYLRQITDDDSN